MIRRVEMNNQIYNKKINANNYVCLLLVFGLLLLVGCGKAIGEKIDSEKQNKKGNANTKLYVVLTVDVEDNRGNEPNLIEGDLTKFGIKENCGINYIMDTFEKYHTRGVFFVNVYEASLYNKSYMPSLLKRIHNRKHEVALHTHNPSDQSLPIYTKEINGYKKDDQRLIIKHGLDYIESATKFRPVSYRSGAYHCNDATFKALEEEGVKIDSSYFYNHKHCKDVTYDIQNQVTQIGLLKEIPIFVAYRPNGTIRKLDLDSMTEEEILECLKTIKDDGGFNIVQMMFHSFSMLDLKGRNGNKQVKIVERNKNIYGENRLNKEKLNHVLAFLTSSSEYEVITFQDYLKLNLPIPDKKADSIIHLENKNLGNKTKKGTTGK